MNSNTQEIYWARYIGILNLRGHDKGCGLLVSLNTLTLFRLAQKYRYKIPREPEHLDYHSITEEKFISTS